MDGCLPDRVPSLSVDRSSFTLDELLRIRDVVGKVESRSSEFSRFRPQPWNIAAFPPQRRSQLQSSTAEIDFKFEEAASAKSASSFAPIIRSRFISRFIFSRDASPVYQFINNTRKLFSRKDRPLASAAFELTRLAVAIHLLPSPIVRPILDYKIPPRLHPTVSTRSVSGTWHLWLSRSL